MGQVPTDYRVERAAVGVGAHTRAVARQAPTVETFESLTEYVGEHGKVPSSAVAFKAVCRRGHPLLVVVRLDLGLVPFALRSERRVPARLQGHSLDDGTPAVLTTLGDADRLPQGECECAVTCEMTVPQLKAMVRSGARKVAWPPDPSA